MSFGRDEKARTGQRRGNERAQRECTLSGSTVQATGKLPVRVMGSAAGTPRPYVPCFLSGFFYDYGYVALSKAREGINFSFCAARIADMYF